MALVISTLSLRTFSAFSIRSHWLIAAKLPLHISELSTFFQWQRPSVVDRSRLSVDSEDDPERPL